MSPGIKTTELLTTAGFGGAILYFLQPLLSDPDRLVRASACGAIGLGLGLCSIGYPIARGLQKNRAPAASTPKESP